MIKVEAVFLFLFLVALFADPYPAPPTPPPPTAPPTAVYPAPTAPAATAAPTMPQPTQTVASGQPTRPLATGTPAPTGIGLVEASASGPACRWPCSLAVAAAVWLAAASLWALSFYFSPLTAVRIAITQLLRPGNHSEKLSFNQLAAALNVQPQTLYFALASALTSGDLGFSYDAAVWQYEEAKEGNKFTVYRLNEHGIIVRIIPLYIFDTIKDHENGNNRRL